MLCLERFKQSLRLGVTYAAYLGKLQRIGLLLVLYPLERYGIAVHLVLYICQQIEQPPVGAHRYFPARPCYGAGAVLAVLYKPEKRDVYFKLVKHLRHRRNVTLSAIEQYQVGQRSKALVAVKITLHTPPQHLLHARVVILPDNGLYVEALIGRLERSAVAVNYHTAHHSRISEIRYVVALDYIWYLFQSQKIFQVLQLAYLLGGAPHL